MEKIVNILFYIFVVIVAISIVGFFITLDTIFLRITGSGAVLALFISFTKLYFEL